MDTLIPENLYLFVIGALLFLTVLLPFIRKEIRKKRMSRQLANRIIPVSRLTEEQIGQIETQHPSGKKMHPAINRSLCVGCGTCVLTCRRKGTLFVLNGKSTLVNPMACDGCGECEKACPMGANMMIEYGKGMKIRVPDIDENFESNVKGIYVIGSLAGAGLIKEAINQGRAVLNHIMKDVFPDKVPQVLIIGSGPAGLSAFLSCRRFGLPSVCIEKDETANTIKNFPKKKIVMAEPADMPLFGPLWIGNTTREKLLEVWDKILRTTKAPITTGAKLESVRKDGDRFVVSASGKDYVCDKVVLALGTRGNPRRLDVPGESSPKVFYALTDATEFAGSRVAIVGAGDSAVEAALALLNQRCRITLVVRGDGFPKAKGRNRERIMAAIEQGHARAFFDSSVREIKPGSLVIATPKGDREIENDHVFVMVGGVLPFSMLEAIGIRIVEKEI
jgi:thioredoxin reductase/ferredoxin